MEEIDPSNEVSVVIQKRWRNIQINPLPRTSFYPPLDEEARLPRRLPGVYVLNFSLGELPLIPTLSGC